MYGSSLVNFDYMILELARNGHLKSEDPGQMPTMNIRLRGPGSTRQSFYTNNGRNNAKSQTVACPLIGFHVRCVNASFNILGALNVLCKFLINRCNRLTVCWLHDSFSFPARVVMFPVGTSRPAQGIHLAS
jgi:hypothetical protein